MLQLVMCRGRLEHVPIAWHLLVVRAARRHAFAGLPPPVSPRGVVAVIKHLPGIPTGALAAVGGNVAPIAAHANRLATCEYIGIVVEEGSDSRPAAPYKLERGPCAKLLVADVLRRADMARAPRAALATIRNGGIDNVRSQKIHCMHATHL